MENDNKKMDFGSVAGVIIVILVLVLGAYYLVSQRLQKQQEFQNAMNENQISTTSDDLIGIEKDINSMNVDNLGSEINNL